MSKVLRSSLHNKLSVQVGYCVGRPLLLLFPFSGQQNALSTCLCPSPDMRSTMHTMIMLIWAWETSWGFSSEGSHLSQGLCLYLGVTAVPKTCKINTFKKDLRLVMHQVCLNSSRLCSLFTWCAHFLPAVHTSGKMCSSWTSIYTIFINTRGGHTPEIRKTLEAGIETVLSAWSPFQRHEPTHSIPISAVFIAILVVTAVSDCNKIELKMWSTIYIHSWGYEYSEYKRMENTFSAI